MAAGAAQNQMGRRVRDQSSEPQIALLCPFKIGEEEGCLAAIINTACCPRPDARGIVGRDHSRARHNRTQWIHNAAVDSTGR